MAGVPPSAQSRPGVAAAQFVGRQREITEFLANLGREARAGRRMLFNVYGDAGVGKTFLALRLQRLARDHGAVTAYADESAGDVISAMTMMARELSRAGFRLRPFEKRVMTYYQRRHELESDPQAPDGVVDYVTKSAVSIGLYALRNVPVANLLTPVDPAATADEINRARVYLAHKFKQHDSRLLIWPIEELTGIFLSSLKRAAGDRAVALFLDGHNRSARGLCQWLLSLYRNSYGPRPDRLLITVLGQQQLDPAALRELLDATAFFSLGPFSETDARTFLKTRGIGDDRTTAVILGLSGRLPMLLATLAAARPASAHDVGDPADDAVRQFLQWVPDQSHRDVAMLAALPRQLNQDVLTTLVPAGQAAQLFDWLCELPFISRTTSWWTYHEVVRAPMLRLQKDRSPAQWRARQLDLAAQHEAWAAETASVADETWTSANWVFHRQERMYHLLCADPVAHLAPALAAAVAAAATSTIRARQWSEILIDAGHDAGSAALTEHGQRLRDSLERADLIQYFTYLIDTAELDSGTLSVALVERAEFRRAAEDYAAALADLNRAIGLRPDEAWVLASRGEANLAMQSYADAITDFTSAIKLDPDESEYLVSRADAFRALGQYGDALADLTEAMKIDPGDAGIVARRALTYLASEMYQETVTDANDAVTLGMSEDVISVVRGYAYKALGSHELAINDFSRAIVLDTANAETFASRAEAYRELGTYDKAIVDFSRAIDLDPANADTHASRGEVYRASGLVAEAEQDFARALELDPRLIRLITIYRADPPDDRLPAERAEPGPA